MTRQTILAPLAIGAVLLCALPAEAQFKLDEAPSAQRAAFAKATADPNATERLQDRAKRRGVQPLSSIGESQSTSQTVQPLAPATAFQAYAGTPGDATPTVGPDGKPLPTDPSIEDPNKPRQPLKPKSLAPGVQPR